MLQDFFVSSIPKKAVSIIPIITKNFAYWLKRQDLIIKNWVSANKFTAKSGTICFLPDVQGNIYSVLLGISDENDFWAFGALPIRLPEGIYQINSNFNTKQLERAIIAWSFGCYKFGVYTKNNGEIKAKLFIPDSCDRLHIENIITSIFLVRDLINYPAEDMTPAKLGEKTVTIAKLFNARVSQIIGNDLLKKGFNAIHAVGRGSSNEPQLIDLRWGNAKNPQITLVGKGVCFDSGGLDLKVPANMQIMKKDMAGAAHALGLAMMIMSAKLRVNLRVLIPAVENMPANNAYKPGDILRTYKGTTIEVVDTDAEGRIILADALALACEEQPELLIDFASLTGAARVAVGTDIAAMFTNENSLATEIMALAIEEQDPIWQLPLYAPYKEMLDSDIADISNLAKSSYGSPITAALFLQEFVTSNIPWLHFDIMGFNLVAKYGRPKGGEAQSLRAVFSYLRKHYAKS